MDVEELAEKLSGKCSACNRGHHQSCTGCNCGSSYHE